MTGADPVRLGAVAMTPVKLDAAGIEAAPALPIGAPTVTLEPDKAPLFGSWPLIFDIIVFMTPVAACTVRSG